MHEISITFERLSQCSVTYLLGTIGVYVLWDSQAKVRPSYIGEGDILKRLHDHVGKFAMPIDGYVAVTGNYSRQYFKEDAKIIEFLLIEISERIGQKTLHNKKSGSSRSVSSVFQKPARKTASPGWLDRLFAEEPTRGNRKLKVHLDGGFDPFENPATANRLKKRWTVEVTQKSGSLRLDHPWKETQEWLEAARGA